MVCPEGAIVLYAAHAWGVMAAASRAAKNNTFFMLFEFYWLNIKLILSLSKQHIKKKRGLSTLAYPAILGLRIALGYRISNAEAHAVHSYTVDTARRVPTMCNLWTWNIASLR